MTPREVIRALKQDGWYEVKGRGSHRNFRHPTKIGKVTVPYHQGDLPEGTLRSIERLAKLELIKR